VRVSGKSRLAVLGEQRRRPRAALRTAERKALWIAVAVVFVRGLGAIASKPADDRTVKRRRRVKVT
jgi:hypothetical protein